MNISYYSFKYHITVLNILLFTTALPLGFLISELNFDFLAITDNINNKKLVFTFYTNVLNFIPSTITTIISILSGIIFNSIGIYISNNDIRNNYIITLTLTLFIVLFYLGAIIPQYQKIREEDKGPENITDEKLRQIFEEWIIVVIFRIIAITVCILTALIYLILDVRMLRKLITISKNC